MNPTDEFVRELAVRCVTDGSRGANRDLVRAGNALLDLLQENAVLRAFAQRLTHPEDLGHAVTPEVRQLAAAALRDTSSH